MSCKKCDEQKDIAYFRHGKANIGMLGCDEHLREIFNKLNGSESTLSHIAILTEQNKELEGMKKDTNPKKEDGSHRQQGTDEWLAKKSYNQAFSDIQEANRKEIELLKKEL